jgi:SAM-dependent methyltransferase
VRRCVRCEAGFDGSRWTCPSCGFTPAQADGFLGFCTPQGNDGFDPGAYVALAALEHGSFWFESRNALIAWAAKRYFPRARTLLEVGCGTGFVLEGLRRVLPQLRLTGADLHADGLRYARGRLPDVELLQFDARHIPFDGEFDVIGAFDAIEHIDDDARVLSEARRAVKPGGGILITVPQHRWLWSAADDYGEHKRRYSRSELTSRVTAAGFEICRVTSFVTFLLPALAAVRLGERLRSRPFEPTGELAASHRAPAALRRIMAVERALVARGVDLRAGGSLLLVGRAS